MHGYTMVPTIKLHNLQKTLLKVIEDGESIEQNSIDLELMLLTLNGMLPPAAFGSEPRPESQAGLPV